VGKGKVPMTEGGHPAQKLLLRADRNVGRIDIPSKGREEGSVSSQEVELFPSRKAQNGEKKGEKPGDDLTSDEVGGGPYRPPISRSRRTSGREEGA